MLRSSRIVVPLALACAAVLGLPACHAGQAADDGPLLIATTVAPLTSIVSAIAGDRAQVEGAVPEGTNSHTFEPPPRIAELFSKADLIIVNGLRLEEATADLAERNKKSGTDIVAVGDQAIPREQWIFDFSFPESEGKPNPHGWTDPIVAIRYAAAVRDALISTDPDGAAQYRTNYDTFAAAANRLADAVRADQATIPQDGRVLLTYHDAYAYFGRDFGWKIVGAVQPRNFSDPTPNEVARLIEQVKGEKVPTIFGSEVFPSTILAEIGRATGARYEDTLRDDDLPGGPGDAEHSWLGLMRYDFITMVRGLGGTPARLEAVPLNQSSRPDTARYPQ